MNATPIATAPLAEDPAARDERLRRKNRATLRWLTVVLLALAAAGYAFGEWLLENPPTSVH